jgi:D-beta-D-heptose 7-phosphate kinase/D-beta-D-heptose 1-phosphate adenosyltransferase
MKAPDRRPVPSGQLDGYVSQLRRAGTTLVFTNGVFDIIHPGHVRYLGAARALGDSLIVGVNTDRSVRAVKGPERPIVPERERAELLLALACVDAVVLFDEETPAALIERVRPDVLVKGADWAVDRIVGREVVQASGGRVVPLPLAEGYSTTALLARIRSGQRG